VQAGGKSPILGDSEVDEKALIISGGGVKKSAAHVYNLNNSRESAYPRQRAEINEPGDVGGGIKDRSYTSLEVL